jgi:hypothetical protein
MVTIRKIAPSRPDLLVGGPDLTDELLADQVQLAQHVVDRVYRIGRAAAGERIRLLAGLPDRGLGGQVLGVLTQGAQGRVVGAGGHRDHRPAGSQTGSQRRRTAVIRGGTRWVFTPALGSRGGPLWSAAEDSDLGEAQVIVITRLGLELFAHPACRR